MHESMWAFVLLCVVVHGDQNRMLLLQEAEQEALRVRHDFPERQKTAE